MSERIRGVFKRPGCHAEPIELALESGAIRRAIGDDLEIPLVLVGTDGRLVCYTGGDMLVNILRPDGALICGNLLVLFENSEGEPESLKPERADELALALDAAAPFPLRKDLTS